MLWCWCWFWFASVSSSCIEEGVGIGIGSGSAYGSPSISFHKDKVMVLAVLAGLKGTGCGRSVGVRRSEGPNADLALREFMETDVEKHQKISCRVLQDRKEGYASELHEDLERVPFPEDVVKKLLELVRLQWSWISRAPCNYHVQSYSWV